MTRKPPIKLHIAALANTGREALRYWGRFLSESGATQAGRHGDIQFIEALG